MSFALTFQIAVYCNNYNIHYPIQIFLFSKGTCHIVESSSLIGYARPEFLSCIYRQCAYNVTLRRVRATTVAVEKQLLHILSVCL
jgi:hypothetical protein